MLLLDFSYRLGIIEDAHKNRGLGIEFLKHIERTHVICFVLDMSGKEGDPKEDFEVLRKELSLYKPVSLSYKFTVNFLSRSFISSYSLLFSSN